MAQIGISLIAFAIIMWILIREWGLSWPRSCLWLAILAALGSDAVLIVFRNGQHDLLLLLLVTLSWRSLRHGREAEAGIWTGIAISLKIFPAILLVFYLVRYRRSLAFAMATIAIGIAVVAAVASPQDLVHFLGTARGVVDEYAGYPTNVSLLGLLVRGGYSIGIPAIAIKPLWMACGVGIVAVIVLWLHRKGQTHTKDDLDTEFAVALALMPFCSPVAWNHYLSLLIFPIVLLAQRINLRATRPALILLSILFFLTLPDTSLRFLQTAFRQIPHTQWIGPVLFDLRTVALAALAIWVRRSANAVAIDSTPLLQPPAETDQQQGREEEEGIPLHWLR